LGVVVTGVIFFILGMTILISQWVMADRKAKSSDYLTGLKSRFYFENNLPQMVAEARHTKQPLTVMMIDMDDFASVNNRFGHQVGDSVLVRVGKFIQSNMRSTDILARYGGDEFVGILPGIRGLDAVKIAERIVKQINQTPFEFASGDSVRMSVSIGLAEYEPGMSVQELVKQADEQMYNAKVAGKNQVAYGTSIKAQYQRIR
jgi:diguanylate cyclase (GGDEF)-like protein